MTNLEQLLDVKFIAEDRDNYISLYLDFISYIFEGCGKLTDAPKAVFIELIKNQFRNGVVDSTEKFNKVAEAIIAKGIVKNKQNFKVHKRALVELGWVKSEIEGKPVRGTIVISPAVVMACMSNGASFALDIKPEDKEELV